MTAESTNPNISPQSSPEEAAFLAEFASQTPSGGSAQGGTFVGKDFRSAYELSSSQTSGIQPHRLGMDVASGQNPIVIQNFSSTQPFPQQQPQVAPSNIPAYADVSSSTTSQTQPVVTFDPIPNQNQTEPTQPQQTNESLSEKSPVKLLEQLASYYTAEQLSTLSLAQLLADSPMSTSDILGPWIQTSEDGKTKLSGLFIFDSFSEANSFLRSCMYCFTDNSHDPAKVSIEMNSNGGWDVSLETYSTDSKGLNRKDILAANYVNYVYQMSVIRKESKKSDLFYYDYYSDKNLAEKLSDASILSAEEVEKFSLQVSSNGLPYQAYSELTDDGVTKLMLKVPVAKLGEWPHPLYGKVSFTQQDFDEMQQNFADNVLGFEPPLFLGHPNDTITMEGAPAEAFLEFLSQEDDVFFGNYEVVNEKTHTDVDKGVFRYSSAEVIRNHTSKKSGKNVGTVLFGHALTNRPFIPDMPRVQALADSTASDSKGSQRIYVPICLSQESKMTSNQSGSDLTPNPSESVNPVAPVPTTSVVQPQTENFSTPIVTNQTTPADQAQVSVENLSSDSAMERRILAAVSAVEQKLSSEISAARREASEAKEKLRQKEVQEKLSHIESLALPKEVKEEYCQLVQEGGLGTAEEKVLQTLSSISQVFGNSLQTQHGIAPETEKEELSQDNPFEKTIERNKTAAAAARSA